MAICREKEDKLQLAVSNSDNEVKIKVDCYKGTITTVKFIDSHGIKKYVKEGKTEIVGKASELKNKSSLFTGSPRNLGGENIVVEHTIFEDNGKFIIYKFPHDYTGTPDYDKNEENPTHKFTVSFKEDNP
jgi:hypothetical protein